jgi:cytidyltransferase-like protein
MVFSTNTRRTREWKLFLSFVLFTVLSMVVLTVNSFTATTTTTTTTTSSFSTFRTTSSSRIRQQHSSLSTTTGNCKSLLTCCQAQKESNNINGNNNQKRFKHTIAILNMPYTSTDKIANEAILNQAIQRTSKLSVVLRCQNDDKPSPSLARLRRYVGEVYSTLWDAVSLSDNNDDDIDLDCDFCDVVVYPQNLPNAAPESWINDVAPDLDSICSHDSICGWVSGSAMGRGKQFQFSEGTGGLDAHVAAINANRKNSNLSPVVAVHVEPWPKGASSKWQSNNNVAFLDDDSTDDEDEEIVKNNRNTNNDDKSSTNSNDDDDDDDECNIYGSMIGGARIPTKSLFEKVAVAGTFDGMHYGHRKLLTLAVSSVSPRTGELLIGVTVDEMLKHKSFSEDIPNLQERMGIVRDFVYRLAPGMKNRVRFIPIADEYGPPGTVDEGPNFDALVLSHETLDNGHKLNEYRKETLGLKPLTLLCTRRTEPHGMSSTSLRRRRRERKKRREQKQQQQEAKSSV